MSRYDNILALDCSFSGTGWARSYPETLGVKPSSGVRTFKGRSDSPVLRFHDFWKWLDGMMDSAVELVVVELPHFQGWHATMCGVGMFTRAQEMAALRGIQCVGVHTGELKKWATGSGNAKKPQMQEAAQRLWPHYDPEKDKGADEADALCLLAFAKERIEL